MSLISDNRIGKFEIRKELIEDAEPLILVIMSTVIIVRAEFMWETGGVEYTAYCHSFDKVDKGVTAPRYYVRVDNNLRQLIGWYKYE